MRTTGRITGFRILLCLSLLFVLSSCGGGGGGDSSSRSGCSALNARIFGGESCNQFSRSPVVALIPVGTDGRQIGPLSICSGVLVTLDDIVTSAHCFIDPVREAQRLGVQLLGFFALIGGQGGEAIEIVGLDIHPFYNGQPASRYDIAMATLRRVPSPAIGPVPLLVSEFTGPGSRITAFGYGGNNTGEVGELKAADFTVTDISSQPGNLLVIGDGDNSICGGDSGGPAIFINSAGVATLAGVNSFAFGECVGSATGAFGFVDIQFSDVLDFIIRYAPDVALG